jgi:TRAP-type C4-dicarboxylate transport system permease small subunit
MFRRLAQLEFLISAGLLGAICLLVFAAGLMRSFGHPLIWSVDMAQLLFIWLCFFGAARAMRQKGHLGIDLLVSWMPHRNRLGLEIVLSVVILVFLAMLAVEGVKLALQNWQRTFGDSGLSYAWVTLAVPAGCAMIGVALLRNLALAWRRRADGRSLVYSRSAGETNIPAEL